MYMTKETASTEQLGTMTTAAAVSAMMFVISTGLIRFWLQQTSSSSPSSSQTKKKNVEEEEEEDATTTTNTTNIIYMDYNGTTPIYPVVLDAMMPFLTRHYGNPGSTQHCMGDIPFRAIQMARYHILHDLFACPNVELPLSLLSTVKPEPEPGIGTSATTVSIADTITTTPLSSCVFTSCGTEADNFMIHMAIQVWTMRQKQNRQNRQKSNRHTNEPQQLPHIITTNIEHPAIDLCLAMYEQQKRITVTRVPVVRQQQSTDETNDENNMSGRILVSDMIAAIEERGDASNVCLVTMMVANNETGVVQPVNAIATYCRQHSILFGTDAAQATGKMSVTLSDLGFPDMIVMVGHKLGAPKGIGCIYIRPRCFDLIDDDSSTTSLSSSGSNQLYGVLIGGGQEFRWRGGTENVPYIVGLGAAALHASQHLQQNAQRMEHMRTRLMQQLQQKLGASNVRVHGPTNPRYRLPNTVSMGFGNGIQSSVLLHDLRNVVAASAGATCHSSGTGTVISSVLRAMDIPDHWARGTVRFSLGPQTTMDEVDRAAMYISEAVQRQWKLTVK